MGERSTRIIPPEDADPGTVHSAPCVCHWSQTSHPNEYTVYLNEAGKPVEDLSNRIVSIISEQLGSAWQVSNRGTRLEIYSVPFGLSDHELMRAVLGNIFTTDTPGQTE